MYYIFAFLFVKFILRWRFRVYPCQTNANIKPHSVLLSYNSYKHVHNTLRLSDNLADFAFAINEMEHDF